MKRTNSVLRIRISALALAVAGIFFLIYPALRPFSDEVSLQGAAAFASTQWLAAHMLAVVAFTLIPVGFLGLYGVLRESAAEGIGYWGLILSMVGVGLTLPFYGGEAYGLHAIGQAALEQQSAALLDIAGVVRSGAGLLLFVVGLVLLAAAAITIAAAIWKSGTLPKWSGIPLAVGVALYLPQFFGTQPLRVVHGLLVAAGCLWIALDLWQHNPQSSVAPAGQPAFSEKQQGRTALQNES
ncbi:MAG: hypothetical protein R2844_00160 [Caldilineales bacterium]